MCPCPVSVPDQLALPNNNNNNPAPSSQFASPNQYTLPNQPTPHHPTPQHPASQHSTTLMGDELVAVVSSVCSTLIVITALLVGYFKKYGCCCGGSARPAVTAPVTDPVTVSPAQIPDPSSTSGDDLVEFDTSMTAIVDESLIDGSFYLAPKTLQFDLSTSLPIIPDSRSVHFVDKK